MDVNISSIVREINRKNKEKRHCIEERISRAMKELNLLKNDFLKIDRDMGKMVLFGSLAEGSVRSVDFDIDIAVQSKKYYQLVSRALQSEFKVDVIDIETVHRNIKENIIDNGKILYEKRQD